MHVKYDTIGIGYNETRKANPYLVDKLLVYLDPTKNGVYLDIGCGTGNYTNKLWANELNVIGIDPSKEMLEKAQKRNKNIEWKIGKAKATKLESNSIDGIIATLTIHHWENLLQSFTELNRVSKQHGNIVIFTSTPKQMKGYWLNHYFPKMMDDSIKQMPALSHLEVTLEQASFSIIDTDKYFVKSDLRDQFLYAGKHNPRLYFNSNVRRGISSFSALSHKEEVDKGLKEMEKDLETNKIKEVIKSYENNLGDYSFIVARKN